MKEVEESKRRGVGVCEREGRVNFGKKDEIFGFVFLGINGSLLYK